MNDSSHLGAWVQMHLPRDGSLRPMGIFWIPLQILGILKACLCRSTVELAGTSAPTSNLTVIQNPLQNQRNSMIPGKTFDGRLVWLIVHDHVAFVACTRKHCCSQWKPMVPSKALACEITLPKKIRTLN